MRYGTQSPNCTQLLFKLPAVQGNLPTFDERDFEQACSAGVMSETCISSAAAAANQLMLVHIRLDSAINYERTIRRHRSVPHGINLSMNSTSTSLLNRSQRVAGAAPGGIVTFPRRERFATL